MSVLFDNKSRHHQPTTPPNAVRYGAVWAGLVATCHPQEFHKALRCVGHQGYHHHSMAEAPNRLRIKVAGVNHKRAPGSSPGNTDHPENADAAADDMTSRIAVVRNETLSTEPIKVKPRRRGFFSRLMHDVAQALDDVIGEIDDILEDEVSTSTVVASSITPKSLQLPPTGSSSSQSKDCRVKVDNVKVTMANKTCRQAATSTHDVELAVAPTCAV